MRMRRLLAGFVLASFFLVFLVLFGGGVVDASSSASADQQLEFGIKMARRGLWSEALFRFRQAERLQPGNPKVLNNLAVAYEAVGQFEEALSSYQEALKVDSSNRDVRRNYSRFVEFYQAFKPDEEVEGDQPAEDEDSTSDDETAEETAGG